jgi:nicotinamidase-related amidase
MNTAFLIIDVQNALCSGPEEVFESRRVIDRINLVIEKARAAGAPVIVIQHEEKEGLFEHGSDGWSLPAELAVLPSDVYIRKTVTDSFHNTNLEAELKARGIDHLVVCGMQSDFCVDTTIRRALALGYPITLVSDGHSTVDNAVLTAAQISAHHNETLANITSFGPTVKPVPAAEVRIEA